MDLPYGLNHRFNLTEPNRIGPRLDRINGTFESRTQPDKELFLVYFTEIIWTYELSEKKKKLI